MHLKKQDADLFFELTWSLHFFVNQQTQQFPDIQTLKDYKDNLTTEDKKIISDTFFNTPKLIDQYLEKNPDNFNKEKLQIIREWKQCIQGTFYIERYLKKYAIFIDENNTVYSVIGLYEGFDEIFHKSHLPLLTKTTLLPFKGKLVYDGLMRSYNIHFGRNKKSSLKETYMRAKQNDNIIDTFDKKPAVSKKSKSLTRNHSPEIKQLLSISKKLKGGVNQPIINSPTFSLLKAAIELTDQAVTQQAKTNELYRTIRKLDRARNKLVTILDRME